MAESIPPLSLDDLKIAIANPHFSTYVFLGAAETEGWLVAIDMQLNLPALRVYRVDGDFHAAVREAFHVPADRFGIVFDWGSTVKATLTSAQAEDFAFLLKTINAARR